MQAIRTHVLIAALACIVGLSGCSMLETHEDAAWAVITYSTMKAIDEGDTPEAKAERAQKIRTAAEEIQARAADASFTLSEIDAVIDREVIKANLAPPDRFALEAFVRIFRQEIQKRVGDGLLDADQRVQISTVLQWIIDASNGYNLRAADYEQFRQQLRADLADGRIEFNRLFVKN